ncbi:TetR/AcrR family transcriptional regulator [Undibacterium terreum]|uniref:Transcriptional regulator n=1 Tax=Undibacterium terreum TaxID=1224302 RepID=A0A916U357_9BURK|nr:TetR/AcrR family transcriptional regulator [Undibacterium terreum]GGC57606.1 transcriptional regulator [Undibacterium terreum]
MSDVTIKNEEVEKPATTTKKVSKAKPRSAGRPRQDDVEERAQELLDAAVKLFLKKGYGDVSLEAIAKTAHVAVRTIYVKFGGKVGLFQAAICAERDRLFGEVDQMEFDMRPMHDVLMDFGKRFVNTAMSERSAMIQRIVIAESGRNPDLGRIFFEAGPALTRAALGRYFARPDIRAKFRDDAHLEVIISHFLNSISGDYWVRLISGSTRGLTDEESRQRVEQGISLFLTGMQK